MNDENGRDFKVEEDTWKSGVAVLDMNASSSVAIDTLGEVALEMCHAVLVGRDLHTVSDNVDMVD